jgi:hypothetical protein
MDPGLSRLPTGQRPDEPIHTVPQSGQPSHGGSVANARNLGIYYSQFYDVQGDFYQHSGKTGNRTTSSLFSLPS